MANGQTDEERIARIRARRARQGLPVGREGTFAPDPTNAGRTGAESEEGRPGGFERIGKQAAGGVSSLIKLALAGTGLSSDIENSVSQALVGALGSEDPELRQRQQQAVAQSTANVASVPEPIEAITEAAGGSLAVPPAETAGEVAQDVIGNVIGGAAIPAAGLLGPAVRGAAGAIRGTASAGAKAVGKSAARRARKEFIGGSLTDLGGETVGAVAGELSDTPGAGIAANVGSQVAFTMSRAARARAIAQAQRDIISTDLPAIHGRGAFARESGGPGPLDEQLAETARKAGDPKPRLSKMGRESGFKEGPQFSRADAREARASVRTLEERLMDSADELRGTSRRALPEISSSAITRRKEEARRVIAPLEEMEQWSGPGALSTTNTRDAFAELDRRIGQLPDELVGDLAIKRGATPGTLESPILRTPGTEAPLKTARGALTVPRAQETELAARQIRDAEQVAEEVDELVGMLDASNIELLGLDPRTVKIIKGLQRSVVKSRAGEAAREVGSEAVESVVETASGLQLQKVRSDLLRLKRGHSEDPGGRKEVVDVLIDALTRDMREGAANISDEAVLAFDEFNDAWRAVKEYEGNSLVQKMLTREDAAGVNPFFRNDTSVSEIQRYRDGLLPEEWNETQGALLAELVSRRQGEELPVRAKRLKESLALPDEKFNALFDTGDPQDLLRMKQNIAGLRREAPAVVYSDGAYSITIGRVRYWLADHLSWTKFLRREGLAKQMTEIANTKNPREALAKLENAQRVARDSGVALRAFLDVTGDESERESADRAGKAAARAVGGAVNAALNPIDTIEELIGAPQ